MLNDRRILDLLGIERPIIQAPMAGSNDSGLAIAVSEAGGLGSLPCATISVEQMKTQLEIIRQATAKPVNVNFFCHSEPTPDAAREAGWKAALRPHYTRLGLDPDATYPGAGRAPFNDAYCDALEPFKPRVVSFHFGMPEARLVARVKAWGAKVLSSATTVAEARWLEAHGCDAIIAQGAEGGGHRGIFLADDPIAGAANQPGTMALVPQIVDAVSVPVIAAGGIMDGRGIAAALMLGASAAQLGTAYLFCPEAKTSVVHRAALRTASDDQTALTNLFTGRPARGLMNHIMRELGPLNRVAPAFPLASNAMAPRRARAEAAGSGDYTSLWAGQAAKLGRELPAALLTDTLLAEAAACLARGQRGA
jgi:nitronate monooxygenase